jgi:HSP20 family protein
MKCLIPTQYFRKEVPARYTGTGVLFPFNHSLDRWFEDFVQSFGLEPARSKTPNSLAFEPVMDVSENEKEYQLKVELPGLEEKDIELSLTDKVLTIKGEKKEEKEEKEKNYHFVERRYGSFSRSLVVPDEVDLEKVEAAYRKGVLAITLPKKPEALKEPKKIEIKAA